MDSKRNYYIGMHEAFDADKYEKDFTPHIAGIELCNFSSLDEVYAVVALSKKEAFKLGIHFPLLQTSYKYRDPQITANADHEVLEALASIETELKIAREIGAEYLLIHFPKPMILDTVSDWRLLRYQPYDAISEGLLERESFLKRCESSMAHLDDLSRSYGIPIVLEMEFVNKWFYGEGWFVDLLERYDALSVCLDFSRVHFQEYMDESFDVEAFITMLGPYTSALHVANLQVDGQLKERHYPAFPELQGAEGWADMTRHIGALKDRGKLRNILFEHKTSGINQEDLIRCYEWIEGLVETDL